MQMEQMSREEGKAVLSVYLKNGSQELRNKLIVHFLPIVRSAAAQLRGMSGSSTEEVAGFLDIPVEKVENHLKYMNHAAILSFEAVLQDMTGVIAKGELEATDVDTKPEESLFYKELQRTLAEAVEALGDKERLVVSLYYYEELKYSEIAEVMGIGQSRVCQIHTKAIKKLKNSLEEYVRG